MPKLACWKCPGCKLTGPARVGHSWWVGQHELHRRRACEGCGWVFVTVERVKRPSRAAIQRKLAQGGEAIKEQAKAVEGR